MKRHFLLMLLVFCYLPSSLLAVEAVSISSPNEKIKAKFYLSKTKTLQWEVVFEDKTVILPSELGITGFEETLFITGVETSVKDTTWVPVYGERNRVRDHYNQKVIKLGKGGTNAELWLEVRAYDEGLAFRYCYPEGPYGGAYLSIGGEKTSFTLPENTLAWHTHMAQSVYNLLPLRDWPSESERPLTLQLENGLYACLAEAGVVNYSRNKFKLDSQKENTIICSQYDNVDEIAPFASPWRVVMIAKRPGELLENNDIILNLNPPSEIETPWWITPGKVMREVTLSTEGAKKLVDFAVKRNLQYVHFDAGWYGPEERIASDATKVNLDVRRNSNNNLDLHEAIAYAKKNNLKVIVYVNQRALAKQLDEILPLYKSWGIDGIKFGFVMVGSHYWTSWLHEAVKKCAKYNMVVDIHDEYRPTGFSRTYPNLMTQEGIYGNEEMPDATHNTILPFTRFIAGAGDYTICYYTDRKKTTYAHQLALAAIYYSPLQYMYWYDTPSSSQDEPELKFFDAVPTVWDETRVLEGKPGEYIIVARRSGGDWFLGAITNTNERKIDIPLTFLGDHIYKAFICTDGGEKIKTKTKVKVSESRVKKDSVLEFSLKASGGVAIHFIRD